MGRMLGCAAGLLGAVLLACGAMAGDLGPEVRVMSFNVRYGTATDGDNHWDRRKDFLVATIRAFDPDLLGTQETLEFQRDHIAEGLPGYDHAGVGRNDGQADGEMMALFYRRERFDRIDGGHFWLSETPEVAGSKSWDSALPRMVTWVKLRDRLNPAGRPVLFLNTHFDHKGPQARLESARLLRRQMRALGAGCAIVLTGDFNAGEGSDPYHALFDQIDHQRSPVVDTYRVARPGQGVEEGTFSGFRSEATTGPRIDWIAASRDWEIQEASIDRTAREGRTPSDHFPVTAVLRLEPAARPEPEGPN